MTNFLRRIMLAVEKMSGTGLAVDISSTEDSVAIGNVGGDLVNVTGNKLDTNAAVENDSGPVTDINPLQIEEQGAPLGYNQPDNKWIFENSQKKNVEEIMNVVINGLANDTGDSGDLSNVKLGSVVANITYDALSTSGFYVYLLTSLDGINWDTDIWVDNIQPSFAAGASRQITKSLDLGTVKYVRVYAQNDDPDGGRSGTIVVSLVKAE